jgi:hypothetical protein
MTDAELPPPPPEDGESRPPAPPPPVLAPPSGPPVSSWPEQAAQPATSLPMSTTAPPRSAAKRLVVLVASAITITALVLAAISFTRGNSWKHRAQTAERHQRALNQQLDQSEADAKSLEGRLATVANLSAKNTDERAFAQSVINGVARLSDATDALATRTSACTKAVKHLQTVTGTDTNAPLDATQVRAATDDVGKSCAGLDAQVTDLQSAISGLGQ